MYQRLKHASALAAWKRPAKDSSSMQLLITQAKLQIQLSGHHLSNETQRLADIQALASRGMATAQSVGELKNKVDAIKELLKEQQDNLSLLRKDLEASPDGNHIYTSIQSRPVSERRDFKRTGDIANKLASATIGVESF